MKNNKHYLLSAPSRISGFALLAAATGLLFAAAPGAQAQTSISKPLFVHAGGNWLANTSTTDKTGTGGYDVGVGLTLPTPSVLLGGLGHPSVELNYSRNSQNGNRLSVWSLTYTERVPLSLGNTGFGPYVGLGGGLYRMDGRVVNSVLVAGRGLVALGAARVGGGGGGATATTTSETATRLGGKLLIGMNFPGDYFVEGSYVLTGSANGLHGNSLGLDVGMRF